MALKLINTYNDEPELHNLINNIKTLKDQKTYYENLVKEEEAKLTDYLKTNDIDTLNLLEAKVKVTLTTTIKKFNAQKTYEAFKDQHPDFAWFKSELNADEIKKQFSKDGVYDEVPQTRLSIKDTK